MFKKLTHTAFNLYIALKMQQKPTLCEIPMLILGIKAATLYRLSKTVDKQAVLLLDALHFLHLISTSHSKCDILKPTLLCAAEILFASTF